MSIDEHVDQLRVEPQGRPRARFIAGSAALAGALVLVGSVDPNHPGHYPTCPFLFVTGLYCPGCGLLRATHDVVHGDFAGAMARNPLILVLVPLVAAIWFNNLRRATGRSHVTMRAVPTWVWYAVLLFLIVFAVVRNLPGMAILSPA